MQKHTLRHLNNFRLYEAFKQRGCLLKQSIEYLKEIDADYLIKLL